MARNVCKFWLWMALSLGLSMSSAIAQQTTSIGGPMPEPPSDDASHAIDEVFPRALERARALGLVPPRPLAPQVSRNTMSQVDFPLRLVPNGRGATPFGISNFVDLDPAAGLLDYACGSRTYDGHKGIDLFLWPFSWWMMDNAVVDVVAARPGVIVDRHDGEFDRNCAKSSATANYVIVRQDDGASALYWHMKNGSVTTKPIGSSVIRGERLGSVGSSGNSTGPHLHFEMRDDSSNTIDPFTGACGAPGTIWKHQWRAEHDTRIVQVAALSAAPVFPTCPQQETPNYSDGFSIGSTVYPAVFLRDQYPGEVANFQVIRPDGSIAVSFVTGSPASGFYSASYWYGSYTIPGGAPTGIWKIKGTIGSQVMEHGFFVSAAPAQSSVFGAILPTGRSIPSTSTATVFATIINGGANTAYNCWIQPETPLNAAFSFQTTNPLTNELTGTPNTSVTLAPGALQTFVLGFSPDPTSTARAVNVDLRFKCANTNAAPIFDGVNRLLLSFDTAPVADIIPVAATVSGDGIVTIPGATGTAFFASAAINIGAGATLAVSPEKLGGISAVATVCETNPANGQCLSTPSAQVSKNFTPNILSTFSVFVQGTGNIPPDPAHSRMVLNFVDSSGILRGQTSVAVQTGRVQATAGRW